ncbi:hypothetical protein ASD08_13815 [Streptomyces sp. Root369]|nr:hypothetical protein ASD08_13815 [Streptomyces sp. Root369]
MCSASAVMTVPVRSTLSSGGRKAGISLLLSATWRWARTWPVWSIAASRVTCQGPEGGDLVALVGDLALGQDVAGVVHRGEQGDVPGEVGA